MPIHDGCSRASAILALALACSSSDATLTTPDDASIVPFLLEPTGGAPAPRPDHSQVSLTYLGRDRVLAFNQWTGEHALWQFERDDLKKCDAFSWPPLSAGRWTALRYTEFTFAGFTQLISLDPRAGTLTFTDCDDAAFLPPATISRTEAVMAGVKVDWDWMEVRVIAILCSLSLTPVHGGLANRTASSPAS